MSYVSDVRISNIDELRSRPKLERQMAVVQFAHALGFDRAMAAFWDEDNPEVPQENVIDPDAEPGVYSTSLGVFLGASVHVVRPPMTGDDVVDENADDSVHETHGQACELFRQMFDRARNAV